MPAGMAPEGVVPEGVVPEGVVPAGVVPAGMPGQAGLSPITGRGLDPFFAAVVEATEEAVLNSLLAAPTVTGRDGNYSRGLPAARVRELLAAAGRS